MAVINSTYAPAIALKSCCRCGAEFPTSDRERVCERCRKPVPTTGPSEAKPVTFREGQIISLVVRGQTNKEIACYLRLSEGTIKDYLNRIFRKVGVSNRTELAVVALKHQA